MLGEERFISGVNGGEIVQIFHEHGGFDDIVHFQTSRFDDRLHVFQRLTRLGRDVFRHFTGFWVHRDLTRSDDHAAQINALNVWADSRWCIFRREYFAHFFSRITALRMFPAIITAGISLPTSISWPAPHNEKTLFRSICI